MAVHFATRYAAVLAIAPRAFAALRAWLNRAFTLDELAHLDDHMLRDIGLTRDWVDAQHSKSFWQA